MYKLSKNSTSILMQDITVDLLQRFDISGPRYTSYPTADRLVEAFTTQDYVQALEQRRDSGALLPLSVYVHIPFCESLCHYCACNKIITKRHERGTEYLQYLQREIDLHAEYLEMRQAVSQLHLGGGSPTFLSDDELARLMNMLKSSFNLQAGGEFSIEVDPRTVNISRLQHLHALGFNRLSFGVQDFDPAVQKAVHRIQPEQQMANLMTEVRKIGFDSINVDLIYGLPKQTLTSFDCTLAQVIKLRPDRIALYAYAHLPERFKPQRRIHFEDLPLTEAKINMLSRSIAAFISAGYVYVGMDHFALPEDALAVAKRLGRLHRNFQGYSTQPDCDLIGLGVSAMGKMGATYSQNAKTLEEYRDMLYRGDLPVIRGLVVKRDDIVRRAVIMALMCQGIVEFESIELAYLIDFNSYFAKEIQAIKEFESDGLLMLDEQSIQVTANGWFFIRGIAMVFDKYLQIDRNRTKFSKIL